MADTHGSWLYCRVADMSFWKQFVCVYVCTLFAEEGCSSFFHPPGNRCDGHPETARRGQREAAHTISYTGSLAVRRQTAGGWQSELGRADPSRRRVVSRLSAACFEKQKQRHLEERQSAGHVSAPAYSSVPDRDGPARSPGGRPAAGVCRRYQIAATISGR